MTVPVPAGCCDDHDDLIALARYLVRSTLREALKQRSNSELALIGMGISRSIVIDLLVERGMLRNRARMLVENRVRMLEQMTDQMAKEMGLV